MLESGALSPFLCFSPGIWDSFPANWRNQLYGKGLLQRVDVSIIWRKEGDRRGLATVHEGAQTTRAASPSCANIHFA